MGWMNTLRALGRRWYVLVVGLLATGGLGYLAWSATPPTYVASGTQLLLPPQSQVERGTLNPLLELGNLDAPASLVITQLDGQSVREQVYASSAEAQYTVETDPSLRGPTVMVTLGDSTPEATLHGLEYVLDMVPEILDSMQAGLDVPTAATVTSTRLVQDIEPEPEYSATLRTVVIAVGAGLVVTIAAAVALDALLHRRARRRGLHRTEEELGARDAPTRAAPASGPDFVDGSPRSTSA